MILLRVMGGGIDLDSMDNIYISGETLSHQEAYDETILLKYSKTRNPEIPSIPGYNQLFLLGIFFFILICLIKKKFTRLN
ncbi:hypothetical protein ES703_114914 [subsurface metagenome]